MADEQEDLRIDKEPAGFAFRSEMWVSDKLYSYWKHLLVAIAVILVTVFVGSKYRDYQETAQRDYTRQIAEVEAELPYDLRTLAIRVGLVGEDIDKQPLTEAGDELMAIGADANGTASIEAYMKAAELYRLSESRDKQREALTAAASSADGVLKFAAVSALANLDLEEDKGEDAVKRFRSLLTEPDFLAQNASVDLGQALEALERGDEARQVYEEFLAKWPDSPRADEVQILRDGSGSGDAGAEAGG